MRFMVAGPLGIHLLDIYRTSNIGLFLIANDRFLLAPRGLSSSKTVKLCEHLEVSPVMASVAGSRLLGALSVMNGNGALVSRLAEDWEVELIREATGLRVERLDSRYTSVGNLVAGNDKGAIVSRILGRDAASKVSEVLGVPVKRMDIASYVQVGSVLLASNSGAIVHPEASKREVETIEEVLQVHVEPATVNRGVPFVSSGAVANSRNMVAGTLTSGPELMIISRAMERELQFH